MSETAKKVEKEFYTNSTKKSDLQIGAECLIKANSAYWKRNRTDNIAGEKWIYAFHESFGQYSLCMMRDIVAKALQNREKLPVASIISGPADHCRDLIDQIDASFGIEQRFCPSYSSYDSPEIRMLAKRMAAETYGNKDELLNLEYRGVRFGDSLYNQILRAGRDRDGGRVFDGISIDQEQYYGHIRNALAAIDEAYEIFEGRKPAYLVVAEYYYTGGLYAHVAKALGAKIVIISDITLNMAVQINADGRQLSDITVADLKKAAGEKCLEYYQADDISSKDFFVMGNGCKDKVEMPEAWKKRKNVFILPHVIKDGPRSGCRHNFYHDYDEWFTETLKIVKDIPDVNWIIKDHPWGSDAGQTDYIRSVFNKYKSENMFLADNELSGLNIKDVADCVITCVGDAGIEYWAYGIPTITAGDAYYCDWGISYQMKTVTEYENILKNISNVPKPSKQSVEMARKYITAMKGWSNHDDAYSDLIFELCAKIASVKKKSGVGYGVLDWADQQYGKDARDFFEAFVELMKRQDLKESPIYQLKYLCTI